MDPSGEPEIHPASPGAVRRAAWLLVATIVLGSAAILAVQSWLEPALQERVRQAAGDPARSVRELTLLWYAAFAGPVLLLAGVAGWLGWLARSVLKEERFPPEGMQLLRPVPVRRGPEARRRGRWLAIYAVLVLVVAVGVTLLAVGLHRRLLQDVAVLG